MNGSRHAREWIAQRSVTQLVAPARDRCLLVCKISEIFVSAGRGMRLRFPCLDVRVGNRYVASLSFKVTSIAFFELLLW